MMRDLVTVLLSFQKEFQKKAKLTDILFITYCMVYPFFFPKIIYMIFLFNGIALLYMSEVVKLHILTDFKKPSCH